MKFYAAATGGGMELFMLEGKKRVHLIGIGGCSMNGLAQILMSKGYEVTGSDRDSSPFTERLIEMGIPVRIGHNAQYVKGAELVIYSAAIKENHVERVAAREHGIPELERSAALGELSRMYDKVVGVAGCHGKTTITSMLAKIALEGGMDATVHVGGDVDFLSGGTRVGGSGLFVTEACEYVESFLTLRPTVAIISNIDDDHLDYFEDINHIVRAFEKYLDLLPKGGLFIGCVDDERVSGLVKKYSECIRTISYGKESKDADYRADNIEFDKSGFASFDVLHNGKALGRVCLQVPGTHNVLNALCAIVVALELGSDIEAINRGLKEYSLTRRRFEKYGEKNGVLIYHDYAHHPAEIRAALEAASNGPYGNIWCVFQCNSYTRAKTLFTNNVICFEKADYVLVPDIYPGRETDDGSVHAKDMANAINMQTPLKAMYIPTFEEISRYLDDHAKPGDLVLTLGSGDVYKQTRKLL